jgi:NADH-quinone oxidoreductase subunit G
VGEARPGWKILRVLGNLLDLQGFDQVSSEEVLAEVKSAAADRKPDNSAGASLDTERRTPNGGVLVRIGDVPIYSVDPLVRRAPALQKTADAAAATIRVNSRVAAAAGLEEGVEAAVVQEGGRAQLPVIIDASVPDGCVRVPAAVSGTEMLGGQFGEVSLEKI